MAITLKIIKIRKSMFNKISLSGLAGSGKTTIGRVLSKKTDFEFVSLGDFVRDFAKKHYNMDINKFQNLCNKDSEIDMKIDAEFTKFCNSKDNLIIDYRLAYHFVNNCFNVFLDVSAEEAVKRLVNANRIAEFKINTTNFVRKTMNKRNDIMKKRFLKIYNTDFTSLNNYHIVINTDNFENFEDIADIIIENFNRRKTQQQISHIL